MGTLDTGRKHNVMGLASSRSGLTLVELMVAIALFSIVITGIYQTFFFQQEAYMHTESRVDMVQEGRAAQFFLSRDLKMAGYDPTTFARTGFDIAEKGEVGLSMDLDGNGNPGAVETSRFALTSDSGLFSDGRCPTGQKCRLSREWCDADCGGLQPIAENIDAIEFCYIIGNVRATITPDALDREKITSVIVTLLMRQSYRGKGYRNTTVYMPASADQELTPDFIGERSEGWGPFNDAVRRKLIVFEVKARNVGMNPNVDF